MVISAPTAIVVDCSFIADLILAPTTVPGELPVAAIWHAPALIRYEFLSVLRGHLLAGRIQPEAAAPAIAAFDALGLRLWDSHASLDLRVMALAHNFSAHDAAYVALAEALTVPLATREHRLASAARTLIGIWPELPA